MKIKLHLNWIKEGQSVKKCFKYPEALALAENYASKIDVFEKISLEGSFGGRKKEEQASRVWLLDRGQGSRILSSEQIAEELQKVQNQGVRELKLVVGGADGFTKENLQEWKADLRWSFGTLTLPHELAAVVALEQIYRAYTILNHQPYHGAH